MVSYEVNFNTIGELKTDIVDKNRCYKSQNTREGLVKFCELHPEIEFVKANIEGYDDYQWEYSASLIFKYTFYGDNLPTLIEAHWSGIGNSEFYWDDFDIDDVEYYPGCQYKNGAWNRV